MLPVAAIKDYSTGAGYTTEADASAQLLAAFSIRAAIGNQSDWSDGIATLEG